MSKRYRHGLKPQACPKCGSADIHVPKGWEAEFYKRTPHIPPRVTCKGCGFSLSSNFGIIDAIRDWNKEERQ